MGKTESPAEPATDDGRWVHTIRIVSDALEALGISKPEPKKRGRKPELKDANEQMPKRKRGRSGNDESPSADIS